MFADTYADTDAIRVLGSTNSRHAADLAAIATTLSSLSAASSISTYGPVAARFAAALADAAAEGARAAVALSERLCESRLTAYGAAAAYEAADHRAGARVAAS
jgi:Excreted virulence factor EspC, type VII ESX diderm